MEPILYSKEAVREMIRAAYRAGNAGPLEFEEQTADELLAGDRPAEYATAIVNPHPVPAPPQVPEYPAGYPADDQGDPRPYRVPVVAAANHNRVCSTASAN